MSTPPSQQTDFLAARAESCRLLGLNPDDLSPNEMIRCDLLTVLRLWLDGSQSALLSGGTADPTKILAVAEVLGKLVPESEHRSRGEDPREIMWRTYKEMRDRGAAVGQGLDGLKLTVERLQAELAAKDAEITALKAGAPDEPAAPPAPAPAPPNVVPLRPPSTPAPAPPQLVARYDAAPPEPWREFITPTGEISPRPLGGGKYWGPV